MTRRTVLKSILGALAALPFHRVRLYAQAVALETEHAVRVKDVAAAVLPESLGRGGTDAAAQRFLKWVREYRAGVVMDHGYGLTRVQRTAPLPVELYISQLLALDDAARAKGAASFGALAIGDQRALIETALRDARIEAMPQRPAGQHVAADLMTFYFRSSEANDYCYRAQINRYGCRGLANADKAPAALREGR